MNDDAIDPDSISPSISINQPRQYALVKLCDDYIDALNSKGITDCPLINNGDKVYIYLGEIPNMGGHCVVSGHTSGKVFSGYHIEYFEELPEE